MEKRVVEFAHIMLLPFGACLILAGIHAYLGLHVIEREVIFVDLALAQIAALGAGLGIMFGYDFHAPASYWLSLGFTVIGAAIFAATRFRKQRVPQEAIIGIVYVVAAALLVIVLSFSGEGDQHIRQVFIGNILLVSPQEIVKILIIYTLIGVFHFIFRRQFYLISQNPQKAFESGLRVRFWDFLFYVSFGIVVTSSVPVAGVLLVFSFLIVPAVCAMIFTDAMRKRLLLGWTFGFLGSVGGIIVSYVLDLPTGAAIVCIFGAMLLICVILKKIMHNI